MSKILNVGHFEICYTSSRQGKYLTSLQGEYLTQVSKSSFKGLINYRVDTKSKRNGGHMKGQTDADTIIKKEGNDQELIQSNPTSYP